ncbi:alpha-aminoadipate/glutamate carrier protein LysW/ArgW [Stetteria hydrogenophila]
MLAVPELKCPVCGGTVKVDDDALPGELVEHDCGAVLEVYRDENGELKLRPFQGVQEDWGE